MREMPNGGMDSFCDVFNRLLGFNGGLSRGFFTGGYGINFCFFWHADGEL